MGRAEATEAQAHGQALPARLGAGLGGLSSCQYCPLGEPRAQAPSISMVTTLSGSFRTLPRALSLAFGASQRERALGPPRACQVLAKSVPSFISPALPRLDRQIQAVCVRFGRWEASESSWKVHVMRKLRKFQLFHQDKLTLQSPTEFWKCPHSYALSGHRRATAPPATTREGARVCVGEHLDPSP